MPMEINNKISDGLVSLNWITDPKLRVADCKSAPAALNKIDKYPEERITWPENSQNYFCLYFTSFNILCKV